MWQKFSDLLNKAKLFFQRLFIGKKNDKSDKQSFREKTAQIKEQRKIVSILFVLVILVIVICALIGIKNFFTSKMLDIELLTYKTYIDVAELEGITIKNDQVIVSPETGTINFVVKDGTKVEIGRLVAEIKLVDGKRENVYAPSAGILCYGTDGMETVLKPDNLKAIELANIRESLKSSGVQIANGDSVNKGQEIAVINDNLSSLYIMTQVTQEVIDEAEIKTESNISIHWNDDLSGRAYVEEIMKDGNDLILLLWLNNYPDEISCNREITFNVVNQSLAGYVLPKTAIVEKDGQTGIYIVYKESVRWVEVTIEKQTDTMVQISGDDLTASIQVVMNPNLIREGMNVL